MGSKVKLNAKEKIARAKKICKLYSKGVYTIAACCKVVDVDYNTFQSWAQPNLTNSDIEIKNYRRGFVKDVHELYKEALCSSERNYKALLKNAAREGLLKRASGMQYVETTTQAHVDHFGNSRGVHITKIEKYLPPDVTVLIFLANCLDLFNYNDKRNKEFLCDLNNRFKHLTDEQLRAKRLELENELINVEYS